MKKLKAKSLYCFHIHNSKYLLEKDGEQIYKGLKLAKTKGLIKKIGVSIYTIKELNKILSKFKIDLVLLPFNIFDQRTIKLNTLQKLKKLGIEIHTRSTFLQGLLTMNKKDIPSKFVKYNKYFDNWENISKKLKKSKVEICLQYALSNPYIDKVILGVDSSSQFKELISMSNYINFNPNKIDASKEIDLINPSKW
jgi:aryl-alcohol dehydrogenase-like predicted oxidoreductase